MKEQQPTVQPAIPRVLGVIPARGGSKRLPRKNILPLAGLPLIAHTILAARHCRGLSDYLVTSEDPEILETARRYGAPTPFVRPVELAGDQVRNIDTVLHALTFMEQATNRPYDMVVLLQPTCPIRQPDHIDRAIDLLWHSELPTLASVRGPYKKRDPNLKAIRQGVLEDYCGPPVAQSDWPPFYVYNACLYAVKRPYLVTHRRLTSPRQVPLVMDDLHSMDVDTELDLALAEAAFAFRQRQPPANHHEKAPS